MCCLRALLLQVLVPWIKYPNPPWDSLASLRIVNPTAYTYYQQPGSCWLAFLLGSFPRRRGATRLGIVCGYTYSPHVLRIKKNTAPPGLLPLTFFHCFFPVPFFLRDQQGLQGLLAAHKNTQHLCYRLGSDKTIRARYCLWNSASGALLLRAGVCGRQAPFPSVEGICVCIGCGLIDGSFDILLYCCTLSTAVSNTRVQSTAVPLLCCAVVSRCWFPVS